MNPLPARPNPTGRLVRDLMLAGAALAAVLICAGVARYPRTPAAATDGALGRQVRRCTV